MYVVAVLLAVASGLFYIAGSDGFGTATVCSYGDMFCQHPSWLGVGAILALVWAKFVSV